MHSRSTRNVILKTSKAIRPWQTHRTRSPHYPTGLYRRCLATQPTRTVIFSGIQPTGVPHLGNYLGALRQWVNLQNTSQDNDEICYSIVDLHALTAQPNADHLKNWRREMLAALLALGLDSRKSVLFFQSAVPEHAELMWILSCTASTGLLSRMTQWKSKTQASNEASPDDSMGRKAPLKLGLFSYPVLQAADVLLYRTTHVPVGEDQTQHLEFTRDCVDSFNALHGPVFVKPEILLSPTTRIMSLTNPMLKMSKSHPNPNSRIHLNDSSEDISSKIRLAVTDSNSDVSYDPPARPGLSNLLDIMSSLDAINGGGVRSPQELADEFESYSMQQLKKEVTSTVVRALAPVREKYEELVEQPEYLDSVARQGAERARRRAQETMGRVREAVGLTS